MSEEKKENKIISQEDLFKVLDGIYTNVLKGVGSVSPKVEEFADDYLKKSKSKEEAVKKMINNQVVKCTTSGFLTGFGGLITLPISIPANISSVLYVQMRMIAGVAYLAGYDLKSDQVQTLVYACLAGISVNQVIKKVGVKVGEKVAEKTIEKIPGKVLVAINKKIGYRFITKAGKTSTVTLTKAVPVVGAFVGGGLDFLETKAIGNRAYKWFFEDDFSAEEVEEEIHDGE